MPASYVEEKDGKLSRDASKQQALLTTRYRDIVCMWWMVALLCSCTNASAVVLHFNLVISVAFNFIISHAIEWYPAVLGLAPDYVRVCVCLYLYIIIVWVRCVRIHRNRCVRGLTAP